MSNGGVFRILVRGTLGKDPWACVRTSLHIIPIQSHRNFALTLYSCKIAVFVSCMWVWAPTLHFLLWLSTPRTHLLQKFSCQNDCFWVVSFCAVCFTVHTWIGDWSRTARHSKDRQSVPRMLNQSACVENSQKTHVFRLHNAERSHSSKTDWN